MKFKNPSIPRAPRAATRVSKFQRDEGRQREDFRMRRKRNMNGSGNSVDSKALTRQRLCNYQALGVSRLT